MTKPMTTPIYERTRQAWRDIWTQTNFDRELATLQYRRAQQVLRLYTPYLDRHDPLLEAGCGPAHIVYYFRQRGYNMIGADYAPEALASTHHDYPDLPLQVADVHHLPYAKNTFAAYLSFGVVEHFEQGPAAALAEAYRVLRPGGVLILTVPHPNFVEGLRDVVDKVFPARAAQRGPRAEYFETEYSHRQLAAYVEAPGFRILRKVPISNDYTFYGLHSIFRGNGYYQTSALAEVAGTIGRYLLPWYTAYECLIIAQK